MSVKDNLYIGIMSGTSLDGVDVVLTNFNNTDVTLIESASIDIPPNIKSSLYELCFGDTINLRLLGETDVQMGVLFSKAVNHLLSQSKIDKTKITAIGSHGQTIYHQPSGLYPFTHQIGDPNIIVAQTQITTVADFRRRDMALGGQGAPLVPAFHAYLFGHTNEHKCVLNIGGIANVTFLSVDHSVTGFDTGPGNTLLDLWHDKHRGSPMDFNGDWARSGKINNALLAVFLNDEYFKKPFPKSTGRDYFNLSWIAQKLQEYGNKISPVDVQTTLTELTASTIAQAITHAQIVWLCGGGAKNTYLVERLEKRCSHISIKHTQDIGIDGQWMEAMAFAWLAKQTMEKKHGNIVRVTGASKEAILGGVYYA